MIVKLKENRVEYPDLSQDQPYFVIGIEADDFRILNDNGKPYLYPPHLFDIVEPNEPKSWITEYGEDGERYSYPPAMNQVGFFEDFFDEDPQAISRFWQAVNRRLSEAA